VNSQAGLTLVELTVATALGVTASGAGALLMRDYMASAKTVRVNAQANMDMMTFLKNLERSFQTVTTPLRACPMQRVAGNIKDTTPKLSDFVCSTNNYSAQKTAALGFGFDSISSGQANAKIAWVNSCIPISGGLPTGFRGTKMSKPPHIGGLAWGGAQKTCPDECPANFRPVIRLITNKGEVESQRVPAKNTDGNDQQIWGALMCATRYRDLKGIQGLTGQLNAINAGANIGDYDFRADTVNVSVFIARGLFDVLPTADRMKSNYIWMTGGKVLEFIDAEQMTIFKCNSNTAGC